ncbi:hypothetical protein, partial [Streptomyces sp. NPDC094468]|uniref:hypothetical protein n=1 Tax=Streptomyces sp. NPDC094468 TaxID=3366066 RepID=UPI0038181CC8
WVGSSPWEMSAVAWGTFAFSRLHYDHTREAAPHTLHEIMDIAQNFKVPYSLTNRDASLEGTSMDVVLGDAQQVTEALLNAQEPRSAYSLQSALDRVRRLYDTPGRELHAREAFIELIDQTNQARKLLKLPEYETLLAANATGTGASTQS